MRYRLILPDWAKNAGVSPSVLEGDDFPKEFLEEKNALGYGIYYFPNYNSKPLPEDYLRGEFVDTFEWVYVDMDLKDKKYKTKEEFIEKLLNFECIPNKIIISGNGVHAYWKVRDLNRERFASIQLRLIRHFDTDKSIWTVLRAMRCEGFYNTKNKDEYKLVEADILKEEDYAVVDLIKHLPISTIEDAKRIETHFKKIDGIEDSGSLEDIELEELPDKFIKLLDKNKKIQELFFDELGDRSENDFNLACLLYENSFNKKDALTVIANTPKARSLGSNKADYVAHTVNKIYKKKSKFTVESAAIKTRAGFSDKDRGRHVRGPAYFDALYKGWRTQQCLGIIGGPGIGKSTVTLDIFRAILENNPESDDICIYFNLEMTDWEVIEQWNVLTNSNPKLAERLYVVSNEDDDGNPRNINLQQIAWFCRDIQLSTGKRLAAIAIDHIGVINPTIDITKKPDFGMVGEMEGAYGDLRNVSIRKMPQTLKELAKQLDAFMIVQSQTTKAKGMDGDTPLGVDAAYGAAQFEQYMDNIITLWQPLRRVHHKTNLRVLGWKYCKIRRKHKSDGVEAYTDYMLSVDINSGKLAPLTDDEMEEFGFLNKEATVLRKKTEKKEEITYKNSTGIAKLRAILSSAK